MALARKVRKGDVIQDFTCDRDGWVWWDEVGYLGVNKVYKTMKKALRAQAKYCRDVLMAKAEPPQEHRREQFSTVCPVCTGEGFIRKIETTEEDDCGECKEIMVCEYCGAMWYLVLGEEFVRCLDTRLKNGGRRVVELSKEERTEE
jgi:RecJ-like exonuclease